MDFNCLFQVAQVILLFAVSILFDIEEEDFFKLL